MAQTQEKDGMRCRSCGREERASEGYPCQQCGTFICLICSLRGVTHCAACAAKLGLAQPVEGAAGGTPGGAA